MPFVSSSEAFYHLEIWPGLIILLSGPLILLYGPDQNRFCSELSPNAFWSKMCSNKIGPYLKMVNASGDEGKTV